MGLTKRTPSKLATSTQPPHVPPPPPPRKVTPHKKDGSITTATTASSLSPSPSTGGVVVVAAVPPAVTPTVPPSPQWDLVTATHTTTSQAAAEAEATAGTTTTGTTTTPTRRTSRSSRSSSTVHRKKQQQKHHQYRLHRRYYRSYVTPLCVAMTVGLYMARQHYQPPPQPQQLATVPTPVPAPHRVVSSSSSFTSPSSAVSPPLLSTLARDVRDHSGYSWIHHAPPPRPGTYPTYEAPTQWRTLFLNLSLTLVHSLTHPSFRFVVVNCCCDCCCDCVDWNKIQSSYQGFVQHLQVQSTTMAHTTHTVVRDLTGVVAVAAVVTVQAIGHTSKQWGQRLVRIWPHHQHPHHDQHQPSTTQTNHRFVPSWSMASLGTTTRQWFNAITPLMISTTKQPQPLILPPRSISSLRDIVGGLARSAARPLQTAMTNTNTNAKGGMDDSTGGFLSFPAPAQTNTTKEASLTPTPAHIRSTPADRPQGVATESSALNPSPGRRSLRHVVDLASSSPSSSSPSSSPLPHQAHMAKKQKRTQQPQNEPVPGMTSPPADNKMSTSTTKMTTTPAATTTTTTTRTPTKSGTTTASPTNVVTAAMAAFLSSSATILRRPLPALSSSTSSTSLPHDPFQKWVDKIQGANIATLHYTHQERKRKRQPQPQQQQL
jgi:hypothetical protein